MPAGKIISVFNEKGGSGKTTTACQLGGALALRGFRVAVADLDPQETSSDWITTNDGEFFPARLLGAGYKFGERIGSELRQHIDNFDIIVADCAPSVEQKATWGVLLVSDLGIIPTKLNTPDMRALPAAKLMARKAWDRLAEKGVPAFPVRVLANAARLHLVDDRSAMESLQDDSEFPPFSVTLSDRKAYSRSMLVGSTVHRVPKSEDSVREVEALADHVLKLIGLPSKPRRNTQ